MDNAQQPIKFSKDFTAEIDNYIAIYKKSQKVPTVAGFANRIGTDEQSIYAWANKLKKDEQGNVTSELARPNFNAAVKRLEEASKVAEEKKEVNILNVNQEAFCVLYASDREFFGNGVQSYMEAYGIDPQKKGSYNAARVSAYDLLTNPNILKRIDELLEVKGLNDAQVDKELSFVIMQKGDLSSKVAAIREYNKLKSRITEKIDHTTKGNALPQPIYGGRATKSI